MYKYVSFLAILATFFACKTTNVSSISTDSTPQEQSKDEWKLIGTEENSVIYEGRFWGFDAIKMVVTEGNATFSIYAFIVEYKSEKEGEKAYYSLIQKAEKEINLRGYGPTYQKKNDGHGNVVVNISPSLMEMLDKPSETLNRPTFYSRELNISVISKSDSRIRAKINLKSVMTREYVSKKIDAVIILPAE